MDLASLTTEGGVYVVEHIYCMREETREFRTEILPFRESEQLVHEPQQFFILSRIGLKFFS